MIKQSPGLFDSARLSDRLRRLISATLTEPMQKQADIPEKEEKMPGKIAFPTGFV